MGFAKASSFFSVGFNSLLETIPLGGRVALRIATGRPNNQLRHLSGGRAKTRLPLFYDDFFSKIKFCLDG